MSKTWFERLYMSLLGMRFSDEQAEMLIQRIRERADTVYHSDEEIFKRIGRWQNLRKPCEP